MKAAGLEMISTILETEAVLIANPNTKHPALVKKIHQRILGYLTATKYKMVTYNIIQDKLEEAKKVTPGRKSPTVNTLTGGEYLSISAMIEKRNVSEIMDQLHDIGATDIIVFDIENCRA
jgi:ATP phosphoribosyltransferase